MEKIVSAIPPCETRFVLFSKFNILHQTCRCILVSLLFLISVSAWAADDQCELIDNDDGTISDSNTGLMWLQDADFMEDATWNAVKSQLETLTVAGYSDWAVARN